MLHYYSIMVDEKMDELINRWNSYLDKTHVIGLLIVPKTISTFFAKTQATLV
jgi:hypothetical protein